MWIDAVSELLPMVHVYSQSNKRNRITDIPLPLELATYFALVDPFEGLEGILGGRRWRTRHARARIETIDHWVAVGTGSTRLGSCSLTRLQDWRPLRDPR